MTKNFDDEKLEWFNPKNEKNKSSIKNEFISVSTKHSANRIYLNSALIKNYFEKCSEYIRFGFYDERYLILDCTDSKDELGYKTKKQGNENSESKVVISNPLVKKIINISGQKPNKVKRYNSSFSEKYETVYIDLKQ